MCVSRPDPRWPSRTPDQWRAWQTAEWIEALGGNVRLRTMVTVSNGPDHKLAADFYSIDQPTAGHPVDARTLDGTKIKFALPEIQGSCEDTLSPDSNSIDGIRTQRQPTPPRLERATNSTAWVIDPHKHSIQFVQIEPVLTVAAIVPEGIFSSACVSSTLSAIE